LQPSFLASFTTPLSPSSQASPRHLTPLRRAGLTPARAAVEVAAPAAIGKVREEERREGESRMPGNPFSHTGPGCEQWTPH
jgi:hypothetical protein